ncbi:MAG: PBP1A family penicillin-binding protein [Elusimicrobia bacterium]|nr:PBP1A family penicillin-binding protein [Elusimicrobiota bacterium]
MPRRSKTSSSGLWKIAFALALILAALVFYAERSIGPLLAGDISGAYPTKIYSAPARLRAGGPMAEDELLERLEALRYAQTSEPSPAPGEFRREGSTFTIHLRGFLSPLLRAPQARVAAELGRGRIESVRSKDGLPLVEAWLEPELLYEISGEKRIRRERLSSSEIPKAAADAVVAAEDRRFFRHHGIDLRGLLRALLKNAAKGRIAQGGSTLTQQLSRSLFLSPKRSLVRKLKETLIALWLEARFSKEEILRMYLDAVYFGQDGPVSILGLKAASKHYFDKKPGEMTLAESALLAGLLSSPYRYDPLRDPDASAQRRRAVLASMRREGFITLEEERRAAAERVRATGAGRTLGRSADYFLAYAHRQLERRHGDEALLTRGLSVHTTLDPRLHRLAAAAVKAAKHQAALVALDARTGAILALAGGKDYLKQPFDRATLARRQPGSAFKPIVYAAGLGFETGRGRWTAASLLSDAPRSFKTPQGLYSPRNYDGRYLGAVPLRTALAESLNLATLDLAEKLGPKALAEFARQLGISSPLREELGLALGASEVTLLELTGAYCAFANGGARVEPYAIAAAADPEGEILEAHLPAARAVLSPQEAYLMTDLLRESVRSGTAKELSRLGLGACAAGKTGTTNDGKDAWFIGYTPRLVAGVWAGTDAPAKLGLTGAKDALPIWAAFVLSVATAAAQGSWPRPDGVVSVEVDPGSGLRVQSGCPSRRTELFLAGTEPRAGCPLHSGGFLGWFKRVLSSPRSAQTGAKR